MSNEESVIITSSDYLLDCIHTNTLRTELESDGLGEHVQRCLGHVVGEESSDLDGQMLPRHCLIIEPTDRLGGADAGDVDNVAFSLDQMWHGHQGDVHGRANVEVEDAIIVGQCGGRIEDGGELTEASIVDQDVEFAESIDRLPNESLGIRLVGHIGQHLQRSNSLRRQLVAFFGHRGNVRRLPSGDHNTRTSLGELPCNLTTDARTRSGDQNNFAFEVIFQRHSSEVSSKQKLWRKIM